MTADLTPAQAARLEAIEAAPWAEEAAVERVARAICESDGEVWFGDDGDFENDYRKNAVAAIDVMRGATDDGAVGRVQRLADDLDDEAHEARRNNHIAIDNVKRAAAYRIRVALECPR
jgi:hypothetical protein